MSYKGAIYQVKDVREWNGHFQYQIAVSIQYPIVASVLPRNENDTPIEYIIASRFGKPGEGFTDTVERLVS